jgi:hypothetical protein
MTRLAVFMVSLVVVAYCGVALLGLAAAVVFGITGR